MKFVLQPWQLMLIILASSVNRKQQEVIGYSIYDSTIGNILKAHGIEPAPTRKRTGSWETFLNARWDVMASIDFTNHEDGFLGGKRYLIMDRDTKFCVSFRSLLPPIALVQHQPRLKTRIRMPSKSRFSSAKNIVSVF